MAHQPHPDTTRLKVRCTVVTVSDTRTPQTDKSGQLIQQLLLDAGHAIAEYEIIPDEPAQIQTRLAALAKNSEIDVAIFNGGTGISPRDTTYDAIANLLEKTLPGFGELFRYLSYQEIGSRAIASRAIAGVYHGKLVFSLPGSTNAVKLGMQQLLLPEIVHLVKQLHGIKNS